MWLALALFVAALGQASVFSMRWDCFDFYQFWAVGQAAHEPGTGNVWSSDERLRLGQEWARRAASEQGPQSADPSQRRGLAASRRQDLETYSTPWLYTLFGWTASGDYDTDLSRFQHAGLVLFALTLVGLARLAGLSWSAGALLVAFLLTFFAPTLSDMRVGNVNRLQLAAIAGVVLVGARRGAWQFAAGFLLGLSVMFKPNLAYCALALGAGWLVLGRWQRLARQVPAALVGAAAAFALSSHWFGGASAWSDWSRVLGELMGEYDHALSKGNLALVRLLEDAGLGAAGTIVTVLLAGALAAVLVVRRRARAEADPLEDLALVG
ncbi:MAG TPA: glycosyltransferase 87 family protein, partial [Planctomycetota bacterium]|nr:glycosyltransferase 87 family protein [Planctomycetota bacterium]